MKAAILNQNTYKLEIKEVNLPGCSNTEVIIRLKAASINHHELWTLKEKELKSESAIIMGSDGAGIVEKVGSSVAKLKKGDEVIIKMGR